MQLHSRRKKQRPLYTAYSLHVLGSGERFSHKKATEELGYSPRDLRLTIRDMVADMQGTFVYIFTLLISGVIMFILITRLKEFFGMELTTIREIFKNREDYLDRTVTVGGWIRSIRDSKTFGFIVLSDGSYFQTLQVVYHDKMDNFAEVSN